ncbi:MAG: MoxR family ATPase [Thermofilaceae archaeon]
MEGSADLTPQKLVGIFNPAKVMEQGFKPEFFEPGPLIQAMVSGGLLYIEEFNRMPEDAANVPIRAAEEGEISVPRLGTIRAKPVFRIVCAMNPYDDVGTSRVSRALLDRFVMLRMDYQSREEEIEIVKRKTASRFEWLVQLAVDLARATRDHPAVRMGSSVRGAIDMVLITEQLIRLKGVIVREDLRTTARMAFSPKIWLKDPTRNPENIIDELFDRMFGSVTFKQENNGSSQFEEGKKSNDFTELFKGSPQRVALELLEDPNLIQAMKGLGVKRLRGYK